MTLPRKPHHKRLQRRTGLARTGGLSRGRINPTSKKRRKLLDGPYAEAKRQVKERADGLCELRTPVCVGVGIEPHHLKGRVGPLLCDVDWMRWTCRSCHTYAEANPTESYERGWLARRNEVAGWMASRLGGAA